MEKFRGTNARGLVSVQALAAFNIYFVGNSKTSREAMGKFLHNMSYQALNKENDHILMEFDKISNLIIELINLLLDKNTVSLSGDKKKTENVINTMTTSLFLMFRQHCKYMTKLKKI